MSTYYHVPTDTETRALLDALATKGLHIGQRVTVGNARSVWIVEADYAGPAEVWMTRQTVGGKVTSKRAKLTDLNVIPEGVEEVHDGRGWVLPKGIATTKLITL